jgi:hypothetical protein
MSRLLDFNLTSPKTNRTQTSNESSIVINNNVNEPKRNFPPGQGPNSPYPTQITYGGASGPNGPYPNYPTIPDSPIFSAPVSAPISAPLATPLLVTERAVEIEPEKIIPDNSLLIERDKTISELKFSLDFYQELALTFSKILKSNNIDLLANIIDNSGKIILDAASLCNLIALIAGANPEFIKLQYEEREATCLAKIKPIHKLENIKVGVLDFKLCYNNLYNILQDKYAVSLTHVLVKGSRK